MTMLTYDIKECVRRNIPQFLLDLYRLIRYRKTWCDLEGKSVHKVFSEIYRRNLWGNGKVRSKSPFYSGPGSDTDTSNTYVESVKHFIHVHAIRKLVDLGCGDFRVGSQLVCPKISYHGVDVVKGLIKYNSKRFSRPGITFSCLDVTSDELPSGELCLIRQVLQHLSNEQVKFVLERCRQYPFVIITEHLPNPTSDWVPNLNINHGIETRVDSNSGIMLDHPPFNFAVKETVCEVQMLDGTVLRSVLLVNDDTSRHL